LDIVTFNASSNTTLATIYPSVNPNAINELLLLKCYDSKAGMYYVLVQDPTQQISTIFAANVKTLSVTKFTVKYGVTVMVCANTLKSILLTYGPQIYKVDPKTGVSQFYFSLFTNNVSLNTNNVVAQFNYPMYTAMVQYGSQNDPAGACFYFYTYTLPNTKTPQISNCFQDSQATTSLTDSIVYFMWQFPTAEPNAQFFNVNYNSWGPNYQFVQSNNFTVTNDIMTFSDFAGIQWSFTGDTTSFSYNPTNNIIWGTYYVTDGSGNVNSVLGGISVNATAATYTCPYGGYYSNIQVVYSN